MQKLQCRFLLTVIDIGSKCVVGLVLLVFIYGKQFSIHFSSCSMFPMICEQLIHKSLMLWEGFVFQSNAAFRSFLFSIPNRFDSVVNGFTIFRANVNNEHQMHGILSLISQQDFHLNSLYSEPSYRMFGFSFSFVTNYFPNTIFRRDNVAIAIIGLNEHNNSIIGWKVFFSN